MSSVRRGLLAVAFSPVLILGCQGQCAKPAPAPGSPGAVQLSPFLTHSATVATRGGLVSKLIDEAVGAKHGEVMWGTRNFGSGGNTGTGQQNHSQYDYGGMFIFRRDGAEHPVTAGEANDIMTTLKSALERELTGSGVRITDTQVTKNGETLTGFTLTYEHSATHTTGSLEASLKPPQGPNGPERLATLFVRHSETFSRE